MQGIQHFLSYVLPADFPSLSKRSHIITSLCITVIMAMAIQRIFSHSFISPKSSKNKKQHPPQLPYNALKITNGNAIIPYSEPYNEKIIETRDHQGIHLRLTIRQPDPSLLELQIVPIKYDYSKNAVNITTWMVYGFHCLTENELINSHLEERWDLRDNYYYEEKYLFHSCSEITFIDSSFSDIRFYYQGEDILQNLSHRQKQALLTKMTTPWSPEDDKLNCLSFFNDIFDDSLGRYFYTNLWEKYIVPDGYIPKHSAPLILYQNSGFITHFAMYLSKGITLSKLGTTGRIMFISIQDLKILYNSPHAALIFKKSNSG